MNRPEVKALFRSDGARITRHTQRHRSCGHRYGGWKCDKMSVRTVAWDTDTNNDISLRLQKQVRNSVVVRSFSANTRGDSNKSQHNKNKLDQNQKQSGSEENHDGITIRTNDRRKHERWNDDTADQHRLQLQRRTDELIRRLRQSNNTHDSCNHNNRPSRGYQLNGSWIMSQVHDIMFEWITLSPTLCTNNLQRMNTGMYSRPESKIGETLESLLNAVILHHQQLHEPHKKQTNAVPKNNHSVRPTIQMYKFTIEAYLQHLSKNKSSVASNLHNAERLFRNLCDLIQSSPSLTKREYHLWDKGGTQYSSNRNHNNIRGMVHGCFALLVHGILNEGGDRAVARADEALELLLKLHQGDCGDAIFPPFVFTTDIGNIDTLNIDKMIRSSIQSSVTPNDNTSPHSHILWKHTTTSLNALIHILVAKRHSESLSLAHRILANLLDNMPPQKLSPSSSSTNDDQKNVLIPNRNTFNLLLHAYGNLGDVSTVSTLLRTFESLYESSVLYFGPDTASYNGLMNAYAKKGDERSCGKAVKLLEWMNDTKEDDGEGGGRRPDVVTYTAAIQALSKNGRAREAHDLLLQIIRSLRYSDALLGVRPDRVIFSAVVDAWARSGDKVAVDRCWEIIDTMVKLSTEGKEEGQAMNKDLGPSTVTFNSLLYAIRNIATSKNKINNRNEDDNEIEVKNSNNLNKQDKGVKALEVLSFMEELHRTHPHLDVKPNLTTYNTILSILGKAGKVDDARDLFRRMLPILHHQNHTSHDPGPIIDIEADIVTVNTFLDSLSHPSTGSNAAKEALRLLDYLNIHCSSSTTIPDDNNPHRTVMGLVPNTRTYNTVLNVLSKSRSDRDQAKDDEMSYQAVQQILDQMEASNESSPSSLDNTNTITTTPTIAIPNSVTYATAIHFVARRHIPHKALVALELLRRMERAYKNGNRQASPTTIAYNGVLNACCFVMRGEGEEALTTANEVYWEMMKGEKKECRPDHITYASMVKVVARYMKGKEAKEDAIKRIFTECCKEGKVSRFVLKELRNSVRKEVFLQLTKQQQLGRKG